MIVTKAAIDLGEPSRPSTKNRNMSSSYPAIAQYRKERKHLDRFTTKLTESNLRPLLLSLPNIAHMQEVKSSEL